MSQSPRLGLSYILPQQAQKHVAANESFRRLDALVQLSVKSAAIATEPASPADGESYILAASPSGAAWSAFAAASVAAYQDGEWLELAPRAGWRAFVEDAGAFYVFNGAVWNEEVGAAATGAAVFGVNATADATNRLSVKSDASLLSHDDVTPGTGDARQIINKASEANTASVVFQNDFSGRAEIGLSGGDDLSLKLSPDGATWIDALTVEKNNGNIGAGCSSPRSRLHVADENGVDLWTSSFNGVAAYTPFQQELTIENGVDNVTNSFAGIFFKAGETGDGAQINAARIAAIREVAFDTSLAFAVRQGTMMKEAIRITSALRVGIGVTAPVCRLDVDGALRLKAYAKAALPSAGSAGQVIFVSDDVGGAVLAFSDGTNWRRVTDRAVVS